MKRASIVLITGLLCAGAIIALWFVVFNKTNLPVANVQPSVTNTAQEVLVAITNNPAFDYWVNQKTGDLYYLAPHGEIYRIGAADGKETNLTSQTIENLAVVKPSPDGARAIVSFGSAATPTFSIFDTETAAWQPLPAGALAAAWDPNGSRIAYLKQSGEKKTLSLLTLATGKTADIISFNAEDLDLVWETPDEVFLTQRPSAQFAGSLWAVNIKTKKVRTVVAEENGLTTRWAPGAAYGLKFTNGETESELTAINDKNQSLLAAAVPLTLPEKCALAETQFYCGVPESFPAGTVLPDDYLKEKLYTDDRIIVGNVQTGNVYTVFDKNETALDVSRLEIQTKRLLFKNRLDQKIYALKLSD